MDPQRDGAAGYLSLGSVVNFEDFLKGWNRQAAKRDAGLCEKVHFYLSAVLLALANPHADLVLAVRDRRP